MNHTKGKINIEEYQNLVVGNDWTAAINQAMQDIISGGTIKFPEGSFNHTGFTVPAKYINFEGSGRFGTLLKNTSTGNAITIADNAERGSFKDIGIMGNGSTLYGTDATSGHGIVFSNNSVSWVFDRVTVRGHGGDGFHGGELGHVNNINIVNYEIEMNKGDGVHFVAKAGLSQINAINVKGCNVSNNGKSGFAVWGNNINIKDGNTVQGNRRYAYEVNSDLVQGTGDLSCDSINIENNYEEQNLLGVLNIKVDKIASPLTYKYIGTLLFEKNYGTENNLDASVTSLITITKGSGITNLFDRAIKSFQYGKNAITTTANSNMIDGGNLIDGNSVINLNLEDASKFVNIGHAQLNKKLKTKVLNNFLEAKGATFSDITTGKSANITSNTNIYYPLKVENFNGWNEIGVPIDTDYTNPQLVIYLYGRAKGSKSAYTLLDQIYLVTITAGIMKVQVSSVTSEFNYDDMYMQILVHLLAGVGQALICTFITRTLLLTDVH
jgi:hypothetical protein